jgi:hypothetical protein
MCKQGMGFTIYAVVTPLKTWMLVHTKIFFFLISEEAKKHSQLVDHCTCGTILFALYTDFLVKVNTIVK